MSSTKNDSPNLQPGSRPQSPVPRPAPRNDSPVLKPAIRNHQSPITSPSSSTFDLDEPSMDLSPPAGAHTHRVAFPWEPSTHRSHDGVNDAGLHSAFAHHGSVSNVNESAVEEREGPTTGNTAGFPRTRTSSSGQGPDVGAYRRKVGFETFDKSTDTALFSYTLQAKSEGYRRSRHTRVFCVAISNDESGIEALDWLMDSLVEDGDEIIAVRVIELDEGEKASPQAQEEFREEAAQLLRTVLEKNDYYGDNGDRKVSIIVEFVAGKVTDTLMRLISLYRPDSLVVGTRGQKSVLQQWMGSVSRYCLAHSPVPVITVKPERKVKKHLAKRKADPTRGSYAAMVDGTPLTRSRSAGDRSTGGMSD